MKHGLKVPVFLIRWNNSSIYMGLAHIFTKSDVAIGIASALLGFLFGAVYLLANRDIKKTFIVMLIMFIF